MTLKELGFQDCFLEQQPGGPPDGFRIARVMTVNKDRYLVRNELGDVPAEVTGNIMFGAESKLDYPGTGDWVLVQYMDGETFGIIHEILPRKNVLKRKVAGKGVAYQLIATNIETAFVVQALDGNFNVPRLERYLTMVTDGKIEPVILLSKNDLATEEQVDDCVGAAAELDERMTVIAFSNVTGDGLDRVLGLVKPGCTYCLLGSSGVGKTSLINRLAPDKHLLTQEVREKDGKGRHATTRRELFLLDNGGLIIDTPGMRELGHIGVEEGISETFADILELAEECRFSDCTHTSEPGCEVLAAMKDGTLSTRRHENYLKLKKESDHHSRTLLEKRRKDKAFGKMIKGVMKHHKKR
jgi:ribosome biogenesis GTPase / thiamine phosphate phosphatase